MAENPRVLVWGPGGLGAIAIRELVRQEAFELVGVLAYSSSKSGVDVADLLGLEESTGVIVTTDAAAAELVGADIVLHLARDFGRYGDVEQIARFLRAGSNVITVHPFQHPEAMAWTAAPDDTVLMLQDAAREGGVTFHGTGIHPGWVADRLAPAVSGICTSVDHVMIYENWDMSQFDAKTLSVIGFGGPAAAMQENPAVAQMTDNYCLQNLYGLAAGLGLQIDRTERSHEYAVAPHDLSFWSLEVAAGTVGRLTHTWFGYLAGEPDPIVSAEVNWFLGRDVMVPDGFDSQAYYGVRIHGSPTVDLSVAITHGPASDEPVHPGAEPGYIGVIGTCLQAVPHVLAAEPGWLRPLSPAPHWTPLLSHRRDEVPGR